VWVKIKKKDGWVLTAGPKIHLAKAFECAIQPLGQHVLGICPDGAKLQVQVSQHSDSLVRSKENAG